MRLLRNVIKGIILTEGAATPAELIKHIKNDGWRLVMYESPEEIQIGIRMPIEKMDTWMGKEVNTWAVDHGWGTIEDENDPDKYVWDQKSIGVKMIKAYNAAPSACWELVWAVAPSGYGPLLADMCLEFAGDDGVVIDRDWVSQEAHNLFAFYFENRKDVSKQLTDDASDPFLTPGDTSDDVHHINSEIRNHSEEQKAATKKQWEYTKSGKGDTDIYSPEFTGDLPYGYGSEYYRDPENWIYRKSNTSTIKALKNYIEKVDEKFI